MSQILATKTRLGILLAADAVATDFSTDGQIRYTRIQRLHRLSDRAAILAGGAAEGESICRGLGAFVAEEGLSHVDDIYSAALPYLASAYERFMRKTCQHLPVDPIHHLHFILAGLSDGPEKERSRIYLIWTKRKLPQLDSDEVEAVYAVPRMIGLEHQLFRRWQGGIDDAEALSLVRSAFHCQAEALEDVGPPFSFATLSAEGFQAIPPQEGKSAQG